MIHLKRTHYVVAGIVTVLMLQAGTAFAQIAPRRSLGGNRGGGYYSLDPVIFPNINQTNAAYQQAASQARANQAQSAMARTSAWQNINQSMMQQANMRTQSMAADRQSAKDWWFETQTQQAAERRARASYQPTNLPSLSPAATLELANEIARQPDPTPAQKEIMLWPTLLKGSAFDQYRARVEAPFRRSYAEKTPMTADDYRGILQAIDEMKSKLEGMSSQVIESEFAAVNGYLDELATDAQKRLDARLSPNPATEKTDASETKP
jgi:hypothetical protein